MTKSQSPKPLPNVIRTTRDLRMVLLNTLESLLAKNITPREAGAIAANSRAVIDTVRIELMLMRTNVMEYKTVDLLAEQKSNRDPEEEQD